MNRLAALFVFLALCLGMEQAASQPATWSYSAPSNVSTATYPGNVNILGTCTGCGAGGGGVTSLMDNGGATLLFSASTGAVLAGINLGNVNTWTGLQTFPQINVGTPGFVLSGGYVLGQLTAATSSFAEFDIQNTTCGTAASADYIVNNNLATATTHYGDFGINSSCFTGTGSLNLAGATYIYGQSGDLSLGTLSANAIHLVANNAATDALTISSSNGVTVNNSFTATGLVTNADLTNSSITLNSNVYSLGGSYTLPVDWSRSGTCTTLATTATTKFCPIGGTGAAAASAPGMTIIAGKAITPVAFNVVLQNAPGAGTSYQFNIIQNGVTTVGTCTVSNTATSCSATTSTALAATDMVYLQVISTGTPAGGDAYTGWST